MFVNKKAATDINYTVIWNVTKKKGENDMKRFRKLIAVLLVVALAIPMLLTSNTAAAAKKVTAKSIMDQCNKATKDVHNLSINLKFNMDLDALGQMVMTAKGKVQDNPVAADLNMVMDMSGMKAFFEAIGNENVTEDDLKMKIKAYADTTDEGFFIYVSADNGANWQKVKVADSMDTNNVMGLDTKDIENSFLNGCKVKETKNAYVLQSKLKITNKMVTQVLDAASGTTEQFDKEQVEVVQKMFSGSKALNVSMTIDKKTYLLTSMNCDATNFINSVLANMGKLDPNAAMLTQMLKIKDCSFTIKFGNYNKAGKITVPEAAKEAAEQDAKEAVDSTVDLATDGDSADAAK